VKGPVAVIALIGFALGFLWLDAHAHALAGALLFLLSIAFWLAVMRELGWRWRFKALVLLVFTLWWGYALWPTLWVFDHYEEETGCAVYRNRITGTLNFRYERSAEDREPIFP